MAWIDQRRKGGGVYTPASAHRSRARFLDLCQRLGFVVYADDDGRRELASVDEVRGRPQLGVCLLSGLEVFEHGRALRPNLAAASYLPLPGADEAWHVVMGERSVTDAVHEASGRGQPLAAAAAAWTLAWARSQHVNAEERAYVADGLLTHMVAEAERWALAAAQEAAEAHAEEPGLLGQASGDEWWEQAYRALGIFMPEEFLGWGREQYQRRAGELTAQGLTVDLGRPAALRSGVPAVVPEPRS